MIFLESFKPKSIEELNAIFEQKLAQYNEQREKDFAEEEILSEEQKEFYKIEETEEKKQEEPSKEIEEPSQMQQEAEEIVENDSTEAEQENAAEEKVQAIEEIPQEDNQEESQEVNELFETEKLAEKEAQMYSKNAAVIDEENNDELPENDDVSDEYEEIKDDEITDNGEDKEEKPVFYFKENAEDLNDEPEQPEENEQDNAPIESKREFDEVKLTRAKDVKAQKKKDKKQKTQTASKNHKAAKTTLNTLVCVALLICVLINSFVFMADMPKRFIANTGLTVCEHTVEGSNVKSGYLLITKKAQTAQGNNIVAALTSDNKTVVDFEQNIPEDAQIYSQAVKIMPKVGSAIKVIRNYWLESVLIELVVVLVFLIARVAISDKKEKTKEDEEDI